MRKLIKFTEEGDYPIENKLFKDLTEREFSKERKKFEFWEEKVFSSILEMGRVMDRVDSLRKEKEKVESLKRKGEIDKSIKETEERLNELKKKNTKFMMNWLVSGGKKRGIIDIFDFENQTKEKGKSN